MNFKVIIISILLLVLSVTAVSATDFDNNSVMESSDVDDSSIGDFFVQSTQLHGFVNKQKPHFKKVKSSQADQISSNNFINPPVKYDRTAKMTLFNQLISIKENRFTSQNKQTEPPPSPVASQCTQNKVQMSDHGQGPEI